MKYGYARVSTDDQSTALQLAALKRAGCKTLFKDEGLSGATTKRPALLRCLKALQDGDTLIVWKLDRLGRSLRDLIAMLDDLKERGVKFRSLTEQIDTETPTGRAMWQMIGVLAELERSLISERTRAGVKAAQRRGVKFGRKPKMTPQQIAHARKLIRPGRGPAEGRRPFQSRAEDLIPGACGALSRFTVPLLQARKLGRSCCHSLFAVSNIIDKNSLNTFTPNDVEQTECRPGRLSDTALQLRDIAHREVEDASKCRLTHMRLLTHDADIFAANRHGHTKSANTHMANGDLFMLCLIDQAAAELVIVHLKNCFRHSIRFLRHD